MVRVVPYMSLTFLTFEEYKASLLAAGAPKQAATLAAGSAGGVTAVVLTYPLDLVRATMATPGSVHKSMLDALLSIGRERGVGALYAGCTATCIGVAPYAGLKFLSYEGLKGLLGTVFGLSESELRPWQRVSSGLLAGMIAQTCVYPLDVIRRRMQTAATAPYTSTWNALSTIAQQEGVRNGLYRGLTLNCELGRSRAVAPAVAVAAVTRDRHHAHGRVRACVRPYSSRGGVPLPPGACADLKTMPNVAIYMSLYDIIKLRLRARATAEGVNVNG